MNFLSRQRKAVGRSHKFVISGQDILSSKKEPSKHGQESKEEKARTVNELLDGFEPIGDTASNELDRRLLFEVAGLELFENEFKGDDSSDSDSEQLPPDNQPPKIVPLMLNPDTDSGEESDDSENRASSTVSR